MLESRDARSLMLYNVELPNKVFTRKPAVVICLGGGGGTNERERERGGGRVTTKYNKCFSG